MVSNNTVNELVDALSTPQQSSNNVYNAVVANVDNEGVVWVHVEGSSKVTPTASRSAEVSQGDHVSVEWRNNKLYIAGNYSSPSAGVVRVANVEQTANNAQATADVAFVAANNAVADAERAAIAAASAETSASQAAASASSASASAHNASEYAARALGNLSTVQSVAETLAWITSHGTMTLTTDTVLDPTHVYFVRDNNGDYQVGSYRYSLVIEPDVADIATYYELSIDESLNNYVGTHLALTGEGLWLLPAGTNAYRILIATGAGTTYTNAGVYIIDDTGGTVGYYGGTGLEVFHGLTEIAHLGYGSGTNQEGGTSTAPYYTLGQRVSGSTVGNYSVAAGKDTIASGFSSHAEGNATSAIGDYSHAEGRLTYANAYGAHAEGYSNSSTSGVGYIQATGIGAHAEGSINDGTRTGTIIASGIGAHAEGTMNILASGVGAHAEGHGTQATGDYSHAEGDETRAIGESSHAEGNSTYAHGYHSHVSGLGTIAYGRSITVLGEYNRPHTWLIDDQRSQYVVIVGNGDDNDHRNDALTLDWDGNLVTSGSITDGNGNVLSAETDPTVPSWAKAATKPSYSASEINGLLDFFYPVGSYYETSDSTFDPNVTWGGTWVQETEGLVHIGAGSNYTLGSTGGSKDAIVPYHNHGTTITQPAFTIPNHKHVSYNYVSSALASGSAGARIYTPGGSNGTEMQTPSGGGGGACTRTTNVAVTVNYEGTSGNATNANMQPYIVVNRWHRTA